MISLVPKLINKINKNIKLIQNTFYRVIFLSLILLIILLELYFIPKVITLNYLSY